MGSSVIGLLSSQPSSVGFAEGVVGFSPVVPLVRLAPAFDYARQ
jgi:hypothetical protein